MEFLLLQFLRFSWIAGTFPIIISSIPKLNFLRQILLVFAKRGKIMHSSSSSSPQVTNHFRFYSFTFSLMGM
jgi:3-oxo-5-alpha-steroid 4-dehydrogenase 3